MTRYLRHGILMLAAILLVAGVQTVVAQDAAQKKGAELYASLCASCHTPTPAKMMGKPVEALTAGMDKVKNMSSPSGPLLKMQQNLKKRNMKKIIQISLKMMKVQYTKQ